MAFEVNTLFLLTIDVEAILGLLLLLVWIQNPRVNAVAWWAAADLMRAASVMMYGLYGVVPDLISIDLANVILFSSFGVTWNGARVFSGRPALPGSLIAGAGVWLLAAKLMAAIARRATRCGLPSRRGRIALLRLTGRLYRAGSNSWRFWDGKWR